MNLPPYQKAFNYFVLLCLFFWVVVLSISLFITHAEQPMLSGTVFFIFALLIGSFLFKVVYKQKRPKHWYQQPEIVFGLAFVCGILLFPTISIFDMLFRAHPLRIVYYLEMVTLFFWMFLALFLIMLYLKNKPDEKKKDDMEMEQKNSIKGQDQLKW
jgi:predicted transporter